MFTTLKKNSIKSYLKKMLADNSLSNPISLQRQYEQVFYLTFKRKGNIKVIVIATRVLATSATSAHCILLLGKKKKKRGQVMQGLKCLDKDF